MYRKEWLSGKEKELIEIKLRKFGKEAAIEKLIEELEEALEAANEFRQDITDMVSLKHLAEELEDVKIAGTDTLKMMHPDTLIWRDAKRRRVFTKHLPYLLGIRKRKG